VNELNTGPDAAITREEIKFAQPIELDFKSKSEVLKLREDYVNRHPELLKGNYSPSDAVFGQIEDGRAWWGVRGQFCNGPGEDSIEGPSEESRFIANPYLLLAVDEDTALVVQGPCTPVYPQPLFMQWYPLESRASVLYDMSSFFEDKKKYKLTLKGTFFLENINARDFGFNYVYADPQKSVNVGLADETTLFSEATEMKSYLHRGGSCGYKEGCNNGSPLQEQMYFKVVKLPAKLYAKLWKSKPEDVNSEPDFTYEIEFM
jgi:hypothetical protein